MTKNKNFTGQATPSVVDTEYHRCNFTQRVPVDDAGTKRGVRLLPGDDTPRTFIECNLCNCEPPPGSTITDCMTAIKEFNIDSDADTITVDGSSVTLQHHVDRIHGYLNPETGDYDYLPTPEDLEVD